MVSAEGVCDELIGKGGRRWGGGKGGEWVERERERERASGCRRYKQEMMCEETAYDHTL